MKHFDVVLAALPYVETSEPLHAPAYLKSVVRKAGLTCYTIDANIEIIHKINRYPPDLAAKVKAWFLHYEHAKCPETQQAIAELTKFLVDRIVELNPTWIGFSLFSTLSQRLNTLVCQELKKTCSAKIVLGGFGIYDDARFKSRPYAKILKKANIIDEYIVGDGELPLYKLLTNNKDQTISSNQFNAMQDLSQVLESDWGDYNWDLYNTKRLGIFINRGCVYQCTFCDIHKIWEKFKFRKAESVFEEMCHQVENTGFSDFYFRDNIINGSLSEYKKLIRLLAEYNRIHDKKITWYGNFNLRSQKEMQESDWALTKESGCSYFVTGGETLVDHARFHMGKKWTNQDLDFALSMAKKYKIKMTFCIIVGYVNESNEDFENCIKWFQDNTHYAGDPLESIGLGGTMVVNDLTDIYQNTSKYNITLGDTTFHWVNKTLKLDYNERTRRKQSLIKELTDLGYKVAIHDHPVIG